MHYFQDTINYRNDFFDNNESIALSLFQNQEYEFDINNQFNLKYEEEQPNKYYPIPSYYLINKEVDNYNILKTTKSTQIKTNENNCLPILYTSNDILNIFNKESNKHKYFDSLKQLNFKQDIENDLQLTKKKRKRNNNKDDNVSILIKDNFKEGEKKSKKRGRKTNKILKSEIHDKKSPDNIIKRVKTSIFKYPLFFLNNILKASSTTNKYELLRIDYRFINRLKKEEEFKLLDMSLKEIYSKNISPKYNKYDKDFNKKNIESIINSGVDNTIIFVFNMTLRDWLDIFTLKKTVNDLLNKSNNINYQNIDIEKIEKNLVRIDRLLKKINEDNKDEDYMSLFIFYLYNYERWFYLKRGRSRDKKEI